MNAEQLYLLCFLVGFLLSLLSVIAEGIHLHLPGRGHFHAHHHGAHGHHAHGGKGHADASFFNASTMTAFLAWFGGTGYLLTRYAGLWASLALLLAIASGLVGATIIFWFTAKVLLRHERELDPADFEMTGVLGTVTSSIRPGGTGEMVYSQGGTRRTCGVRSEDGTAVARGTEVVVTRYERGLAYVRPWDSFGG